jgi:DNA adenine methylase
MEDSPLPGYLGSKNAAGSVERLLRLFPPHSMYVECFLGGGACLRAKTPALSTIAIDADARVIAAWRKRDWPGVYLLNEDALEWLERAPRWIPRDALVYADPPYPLSTRTSRKRYAHEFTDEQHERLLALLDALPCSVVVSSYANPLYRAKLKHWPIHEHWRAMTRGGVRVEHAWAKHAPAELVRMGSDPRYLGHNFRDRERIKRKAARWARKFETMPARDRVAVLSDLLERFGAAASPDAAMRDPGRNRQKRR